MSGAPAYPALFVAADAASREGQRGHKRLVYAELILLVSAAALGTFESMAPTAFELRWSRMLAAVFLALAVLSKLAGRQRAFDAEWFAGRAVAETVKSATWRYAMRVPPYDGDASSADATFLRALDETLQARDTLAAHLYQLPPESAQVTEFMRELRDAPLAERKAAYLKYRVRDQIAWYAGRAAASARSASRWFWASLGLEGLAMVLAIVLIAATGAPDVVSLLATLAVAAAAWAQIGRFDELSRSYTLAAHELARLRAPLELATTESSFATAVAETEAAISREHTMWMAKRG